MQDRHPLLRASLSVNRNHEPLLHLERPCEIPVETDLSDDPAHWKSCLVAGYQIPFPRGNVSLSRCVLIRNAHACDLLLFCHHAISDGLSMVQFAADLMTSLSAPDFVLERLPLYPRRPSAFLPPRVKLSLFQKWIRFSANRKWAGLKDNFAYISDSGGIANSDLDDAEMLFQRLSAEETQNLVRRCREASVTVNTAVCTAFQRAAFSHQPEADYLKRVSVLVGCRDRYTTPAENQFGLHAGAIEVAYRYCEKRSFWDNAKRLHRRIYAKLNDNDLFGSRLFLEGLDPTIIDAMVSEIKRGKSPDTAGDLPSGTNAKKSHAMIEKITVANRFHRRARGLIVSNLGRLPLADTYGDFRLKDFVFAPYTDGFNEKVVGVSTVLGRLNLTFCYRQSEIERNTATAIVTSALAYLGRIQKRLPQ